MSGHTRREAKHPQTTFDRKSGPMPVLKPSAEPQRPELAGPEARPAADAAAPGCLSPKEVVLRLVETVKAL